MCIRDSLKYCQKEQNGSCRAEGLHAESNAIASAAMMGSPVEDATIYCLYAPCRSCCNLIKSAGIIEVKYKEVYPGFPESHGYLVGLGIKAEKIDETPTG